MGHAESGAGEAVDGQDPRRGFPNDVLSVGLPLQPPVHDDSKVFGVVFGDDGDVRDADWNRFVCDASWGKMDKLEFDYVELGGVS